MKRTCIEFKNFEEAVKQVLLRKTDTRATYENKRPTNEELKQKWKLEKRKP